jgi:hypothetical protein
MMCAFVRGILVSFALSSLCFAQAGDRTNLYPSNAKPRKNTASLVSAEQRVGNVVYQIFYFRNDPKREAFRVDIGFYDKDQLVKDWSYGIILEKDTTGHGTADYVWYGGDDTGQRLLWFRSNDNHRECVNVFRSAEAAWKKKFGKTAPDLGEVGGDYEVGNVIWDERAQLLTVSVGPNDVERTNARKVRLAIAPIDFVYGER